MSDRLSVVIPFGTCATILRSGGREYRWASPHHAFFIPPGERVVAESTSGAFIRLDIRESALMRTAAGMLDRPAGKTGLDTSAARTLPMQSPGVNWLPVIRGLCKTVDAFECDATRLEAAGMTDMILRTVVMMLAPHLAVDDRLAGVGFRRLSLHPRRAPPTVGG